MRCPHGLAARLAALLVLGPLLAGGGPALAGDALAADAPAPAFGQPIACTPGADCWVQNYVDEDPGPGRADFTCGPLSYDGHKGTDIRVADMPAMERGVPVLAAAPGVVRAIRDGMDDVNIRKIGHAALKGRDAGNSVAIMHGNGWETQYGHMKRGSVVVKAGDHVEAGQKLGLVGLSGNTEFPHVHFEVRHDGKTVDPYVGERAGKTAAHCGGERHPMWTAEAAAALAYRPTAGLAAGFATEPFNQEHADAGAYAADTLPGDAPALVFWAQAMGVRKGDSARMLVTGPGGTVVERTQPVGADRALWTSYIGSRRPPDGWAAGTYTGRLVVMRGDATVVDLTRRVTVR